MANTNGTLTKNNNFNINNSLPDVTTKSGDELLASMWGIDANKKVQITNMNKIYFGTHGMFASVPIICRDKDCAYKDVCMVDPAQRTFGSRCLMEISAIITRYNQWCKHFNIDTDGETIADKDLVDATLIKDLVNIEVQIMRAENKIALNGDFMAETILEIDKKCNVYKGNVVTPESEFLMTLQDKKVKILNQLNATRKDKANNKIKESPSDEAIRIFQQMKELQKNNDINNYDIMDVEFDENGEIIVDSESSEQEISQPSDDQSIVSEEKIGE